LARQRLGGCILFWHSTGQPPVMSSFWALLRRIISVGSFVRSFVERLIEKMKNAHGCL
jgi:hypothetical protein